MLRDTFDSIIPPENLREFLKRDPAHSRLQLLGKKGVLSSVYWSKLYPATPTEVSSASFDIPLLIVLLRTICNLSSPPAGWDIPPLTADTSRECDIARIKYFMNAVSKHATEVSVVMLYSVATGSISVTHWYDWVELIMKISLMNLKTRKLNSSMRNISENFSSSGRR